MFEFPNYKMKMVYYLAKIPVRFYKLLFCFVMATVQTYILFALYYGNINDVEIFTSEKFRLYLGSIFVVFSFNVLILSVLINLIATFVTTNTIFLLLSIANIFKMKYRDFPIIPEDIKLLPEAIKMLSILPVWLNVLILFFVILIVKFTITYLTSARYGLRIRFLYVPFFIIALTFITVIGGYIKNPNFIKNNSDNIFNTQFHAWNQKENYRVNGPVMGFLYNIGLPEVEKPNNYSEKTIKNIVDKYKKIAVELNENRTDVNKDIDYIFIMSESFVDPKRFEILDDFKLNQDPIPFTRKILSKASSGIMFGSEYGGGTANVEFEVLTGFSGAFNPGISYYNMFAAKDKNLPNLVKYFNDNDYQTIALHSYDGNMYKRKLVYNNFGFKKFIDAEKMKYQDKLEHSEYISDQSTFKEIQDVFDSDSKSKFIFAVTMQNHASWDGKYDLKTNFMKSTTPEDKNSEIENYLQGLNYSDQALENFINYINNRKRKTVLVFWGDHGVNLYDEFMSEESELVYKTPLFFYSNFEMTGQDLGEISANYIAPTLFSKMNLKLSPYNTMLLELKNKYPSINVSTLPEIKDEIIKDYQLIRYDILAGKKYSLKEKFFDVKQ